MVKTQPGSGQDSRFNGSIANPKQPRIFFVPSAIGLRAILPGVSFDGRHPRDAQRRVWLYTLRELDLSPRVYLVVLAQRPRLALHT